MENGPVLILTLGCTKRSPFKTPVGRSFLLQPNNRDLTRGNVKYVKFIEISIDQGPPFLNMTQLQDENASGKRQWRMWNSLAAIVHVLVRELPFFDPLFFVRAMFVLGSVLSNTDHTHMLRIWNIDVCSTTRTKQRR